MLNNAIVKLGKEYLLVSTREYLKHNRRNIFEKYTYWCRADRITLKQMSITIDGTILVGRVVTGSDGNMYMLLGHEFLVRLETDTFGTQLTRCAKY